MTVAGTSIPTIGFTGHVNDADTGLTYMQQRYYDPVAGRFLSTDPVLTDYNSGASFNRYTYANNNPYKYIDPDGRQGALAACAAGPFGCAAGIGLTAITLYQAHKTIKAIQSSSNNTTTKPPEGEAKPVPSPSGTNSTEPKPPTSPVIDPKNVGGKTADEIDKLAGQLGLQPKGPDPKGGRGGYIDPVTGEQRILIHPLPSGGSHTHVNNPQGDRLDINGNVVKPESPAAHLPLKEK